MIYIITKITSIFCLFVFKITHSHMLPKHIVFYNTLQDISILQLVSVANNF